MRTVFYGDVPHRIAGAQKSLLATVLRSQSFGLDPVMVFPGRGAFEEKCRAEGLSVRVLEGPPSFHVFGKALLHKSKVGQAGVIMREAFPYARRFAKLLDEERAEVVHYNTARGLLLAGWGAHLSGRSTVMHQRGSVAIGRAPWLVAQCLADWILLVAKALMPEVLPSKRSRASVLYNGLDTDKEVVDQKVARAEIARRFSTKVTIDDDTRIFVSLSSPVPFKGLHYLVEAAAIAREKGVRAVYICAGQPRETTYIDWLNKKIEALGLQNTVVLAGFVEDTHSLLCAADALVLPTVQHERIEVNGEVLDEWSNEGLPRSILEAMVAKVPSIASDIAGVSEQIEDGVSGLIVPPREPSALAEAIVRVARDADFRDKAGERALEIVAERFRLDDAAKGLVAALSRVASERFGLSHKLASWPALFLDAAQAR